MEIVNNRISELEKKYDVLKEAYKEQTEAIREVAKDFKKMDIQGIVKEILKNK